MSIMDQHAAWAMDTTLLSAPVSVILRAALICCNTAHVGGPRANRAFLLHNVCLLMSGLQLGVELPEPQQGHLLDLVPTQDGARAVAALQVWLGQHTRQMSHGRGARSRACCYEFASDSCVLTASGAVGVTLL